MFLPIVSICLDDNGTGFRNPPELHDEGEKTFLGKTGNFKGEDIVDIILQQPSAPHFISRFTTSTSR